MGTDGQDASGAEKHLQDLPGVKALDRVHFELKEGEIHALMGENGAGKSTFIKVITGVHQPDEGGEFTLDGKPVHFANPREAARAGHRGHLPAPGGLPAPDRGGKHLHGHEMVTGGPVKRIQWKKTNDRARELLRSLGSSISPPSGWAYCPWRSSSWWRSPRPCPRARGF
jgi:rhamnose transport system ATP-binding protein